MSRRSGTLRVGTRGSLLALTQTRAVVRLIRRRFPSLHIREVVIKTTGDKIKDAPLSRIGGKGLFIKEIEEALLAGKIDFAVHSLKDLPTDLPRGLALGAVTKRVPPNDVLISKAGYTLRTLPRGGRVGTSSLRRQAQILWLRPDLRVENLRGNLDTRVRKLSEGLYDAIIVAAAGLKRLGFDSPAARRARAIRIRPIPLREMLPAVGQGSLAIELRSEDPQTLGHLRFLDHAPSRLAALSERSFLRTLEGGCQVPVGVATKVSRAKIELEGMIASPSGKKKIQKKMSSARAEAEQLGERLAARLLRLGGRRILEAIRP